MTNEHSHPTPSSIRDDSICEPSLPPNKSSGDIGELKPCPFCGGPAHTTKEIPWGNLAALVMCTDNDCTTAHGDTVAKAIAKWNTRTPDPESAAEIERLRRERDEARLLVVEANNSLYGSQGYFHSTNGGPFDKYHLARPIEELKSRAREALTAESAATELQAELSRLQSELDVANKNHRSMAHQLAETGIRLEHATERAVEAVMTVVSSRDDLGYTHFVEIASAIRAAGAGKTAESGHSPSTHNSASE